MSPCPDASLTGARSWHMASVRPSCVQAASLRAVLLWTPPQPRCACGREGAPVLGAGPPHPLLHFTPLTQQHRARDCHAHPRGGTEAVPAPGSEARQRHLSRQLTLLLDSIKAAQKGKKEGKEAVSPAGTGNFWTRDGSVPPATLRVRDD